MGGLMEMRNISKSFGPVQVLKDSSLTLRPGTITAIAGENGAGKSTLIKVLSGAEPATSGGVFLDGTELPSDPGRVIDAGISVIYQELTDIPDMPLVDNVLLGRQSSSAGFVRRADSRREAREALERVGLGGLDLSKPMRSFSLAQRQLAEIARCLARETTVLVLDEPTSSLAEKDVESLLTTLESLRDQGLSILYISHHLDEVFRIADVIAVLRDGSLVDTRPTAEWDHEALIQGMIGHELENAAPWRERTLGDTRLTVDGLTGAGFRDSTMHVKASEIVGLVGLDGSGHRELMRGIAGVVPSSAGGVGVSGIPVRRGGIVNAKRQGVVYSPMDRKTEGLSLTASVEDNLVYGVYQKVSRFGWLSNSRIRALAKKSITDFGIKTSSSRQVVGRLSGGNQQKVVLARLAENEPLVALLDDPTRGVDVGARAAIHDEILRMAESGMSLVVTSSDSDEVLAMCDRVYIMRAGRIVAERERAAYDREEILHLAAAG